MKKNIILIGMPGAGKSTVGVVLAKHLGRRFLDSDLILQEQEGRLLHEIIEQDGIDGFLALENRVGASLQAENAVIATGGSIVYGREAMEHFRATGTICYLRLSCDAIRGRLGDLKERGVVMRPGQTLEDLYRERTPLYETWADWVVDCGEKPIREIVLELARREK